MLYIMRHGRTDWNEVYKLQGSVDIPLNDSGRSMAIEAGEKYKDMHIDVCYCSPLSRARETAELVLKGRDVPIIEDSRLREMSFGVCEGVENVFEHPEIPAYKLFKDPINYVAPEGAETFEELYERTGEFMREVIKPELMKGRDILIVGHGAMNGSIIGRANNTPLEKFWDNLGRNCELTQIESSLIL